MSWSKTDVDLPLLNGIDDILGTLNQGASNLETVLNTTLTALDAAKVAYIASADPFSFLFESLLIEVENLINDTFNSSASVLICNPLTLGKTVVEEVEGEFINTQAEFFTFENSHLKINNKNISYKFDKHGIPQMTPAECINAMIASFEDLGDQQRPQFTSSAQVASFGVIITAPDLVGFVPLLTNLLDVFNLRPLSDLLNKYISKANLDPLGNPDTSKVVSRAPDWTSYKLSSIGALGEQRNELIKILNTLRGYVETADNAVVSLINVIETKISNLLDTVSSFNDLITRLRSVSAASGVWTFNLPASTGGVELIQEQLRISAEDPDQRGVNLLNIDSGYTVGVLFVGGGPSLSAVDTIRDLIFQTSEVLSGQFFDEIQTIAFSDVPEAGTWRLEFGDLRTVDLAFDASNTEIQTALRDLATLSDVEVQGDYTSQFTVRFSGADGRKDQPDLKASEAGSNEVQIVRFSEKPTTGSFAFRYNKRDNTPILETGLINFNANSAVVQSALESIFGSGSVNVTGSYTSGFTITWIGAYEHTEIYPLTFSNTLLAQTRPVSMSVSRNVLGRPPANNLTYNSLPVTITFNTSRQGKS